MSQSKASNDSSSWADNVDEEMPLHPKSAKPKNRRPKKSIAPGKSIQPAPKDGKPPTKGAVTKANKPLTAKQMQSISAPKPKKSVKSSSPCFKLPVMDPDILALDEELQPILMRRALDHKVNLFIRGKEGFPTLHPLIKDELKRTIHSTPECAPIPELYERMMVAVFRSVQLKDSPNEEYLYPNWDTSFAEKVQDAPVKTELMKLKTFSSKGLAEAVDNEVSHLIFPDKQRQEIPPQYLHLEGCILCNSIREHGPERNPRGWKRGDLYSIIQVLHMPVDHADVLLRTTLSANPYTNKLKKIIDSRQKQGEQPGDPIQETVT
jgi:hypothetical protein